MWAEGPPSEQRALIGSALRLGHWNSMGQSVVCMKGPSPCEPSAVPSCEEIGSAEGSAEPSPGGSAEPSPENQGSPENQVAYVPSAEPFSSHEGSRGAGDLPLYIFVISHYDIDIIS